MSLDFGSITMSEIINKIVFGAVALTVCFLLLNVVVLPHFNDAYNTSVTGLSSSTTQGLILLSLVLALIGMSINFLPGIEEKFKKK